MNKLVVFTSDREWSDLPETKISSLICGIKQVKIALPDIILKSKLIEHFAAQNRYSLKEIIASHICMQKHSNIRELEGEIYKITLLAELYEQELTLDFVKNFYIQSVKR